MVYRDGLENRYGLTAIGGSNPSPSAKRHSVNMYLQILVWALIVGVIFFILWRKGYLLRLANYVQETRDELKKCTWPTWDEIKGSTLVVMISILLLGGFTVGIDFVLLKLVRWITL